MSDPIFRVASAVSVRLASTYPSAAFACRLSLPAPKIDVVDGGPYRVAGDVALDGDPVTPVQRRVRLLERKTARLVREAWSDPITGAFEFEKVAWNEYVVLTDDYTKFHNAVVADLVAPEL